MLFLNENENVFHAHSLVLRTRTQYFFFEIQILLFLLFVSPVGILSVSIGGTSANPNPSENVLATLRQQEVAGLDFFQWTIEKLRSKPYSLPDGLATRLVTLINDLNSQRIRELKYENFLLKLGNTQNYTSVYRFARKHGIFKNWEIEEDPSIISQRGIGENVFNDYPCVPVQGSNPASVKSIQLGSLRVYGDGLGWEVKDSLSDSVKHILRYHDDLLTRASGESQNNDETYMYRSNKSSISPESLLDFFIEEVHDFEIKDAILKIEVLKDSKISQIYREILVLHALGDLSCVPTILFEGVDPWLY
ncbi:hypothetical protein RhiirA4_548569 [Rhizophagus irregularis]|uniref:Uncharacterized protein n=1 Tax=Rhizophagus irregularis TaxID=588596 RepID=A0A2I1H892_9GLOM|nr:hypothetical protein RhiirA4_548569 [Rhizophagus irregularis]